jgi:hypothetical protein
MIHRGRGWPAFIIIIFPSCIITPSMSAAEGTLSNSENRKIAAIRRMLRRENFVSDSSIARVDGGHGGPPHYIPGPGKLGSTSKQLHPRHRGFLAYVTTRGFARFGVGRDDVAFTLARIFSLAIAPGSRSLASALPFARVPADALDLRRSRRARRVLGTYHAAGESQCDRGREHRPCYPGFVHRLNLLSGLKSGDDLKAPIFRDLSQWLQEP